VQYARAAKKVDVKKLKDNLWSSMGLEKVSYVTHRIRRPDN
jgi:condensin complex subunit 2